MYENKREPRPVYSPDYVRDVSEAVYRLRLGEEDAARMEEKHGPQAIRKNAGAYDPMTRAYLDTLNAIGLRARTAEGRRHD